MAKNGFTKLTKEQRERLRARRIESREVLRTRLLDETRLGCYLYIGGSDGDLSPREVTFLRRECGSSQSDAALPSLDSLTRKVRSFLIGCRPSLRERRELMAKLLEFAVCDGPLSSDEGDALKVLEDLLQVSPVARKNQKRAWGTSSTRATGRKTATKKGGRDAARGSWGQRRDKVSVERPQPQRSHWSYEYLGCTEHDTDEAIKRAYRQLALKLHPDKYASRVLSPEETLSRLRAFQKLQQAYEAIWRLRGA